MHQLLSHKLLQDGAKEPIALTNINRRIHHATLPFMNC